MCCTRVAHPFSAQNTEFSTFRPVRLVTTNDKGSRRIPPLSIKRHSACNGPHVGAFYQPTPKSFLSLSSPHLGFNYSVIGWIHFVAA